MVNILAHVFGAYTRLSRVELQLEGMHMFIYNRYWQFSKTVEWTWNPKSRMKASVAPYAHVSSILILYFCLFGFFKASISWWVCRRIWWQWLLPTLWTILSLVFCLGICPDILSFIQIVLLSLCQLTRENRDLICGKLWEDYPFFKISRQL